MVKLSIDSCKAISKSIGFSDDKRCELKESQKTQICHKTVIIVGRKDTRKKTTDTGKKVTKMEKMEAEETSIRKLKKTVRKKEMRNGCYQIHL